VIIRNKLLDTDNHTYIFGILNVTPDSFSDGGLFNSMDKALFHVERMIEEGADVIDVGGESTRPGYTKISDEEEIERTAPLISAIRKRFDIPISLDTYKSGVAKAGIEAGADIINDIWGLKADPGMAGVIAENNTFCCLMHNRNDMNYVNLIEDICTDLRESVSIAHSAGIEDEKIILDPGVGFAKTREHNLEVIAQIKRFSELGYPVLLGSSRKSVIGLTLDVPVDQRLEGTIATSVIAALNHVGFVRVHDIESNVRAIKMTEAIRDYV